MSVGRCHPRLPPGPTLGSRRSPLGPSASQRSFSPSGSGPVPAAMAPLAAALLWVLLLRPHGAGTWRQHTPRLRVTYRGEGLGVGAQGVWHRAVGSPPVATSPPTSVPSPACTPLPEAFPPPGDVVPWGGGSMGPHAVPAAMGRGSRGSSQHREGWGTMEQWHGM